MLRSMEDMEGYEISATDGHIGRVKDFYFDDEAWVIRYLVVALGGDLPHRDVLISPISVNEPDWAAKILPVALTRDQIIRSPDVDTEKPISRQEESGYLGYYGYGTYWGGGGLWGAGIYPDILQAGREPQQQLSHQPAAHHANAHLRSGNTIAHYYVNASDGDIGHVEGILVDERSWAIRYLIVNTSNWWIGHQVLIAPQWITYLSWTENMVSVGMTRTEVRQAPRYDRESTLDRRAEVSIHGHYERRGYWLDEDQREAVAVLEANQPVKTVSARDTV